MKPMVPLIMNYEEFKKGEVDILEFYPYRSRKDAKGGFREDIDIANTPGGLVARIIVVDSDEDLVSINYLPIEGYHGAILQEPDGASVHIYNDVAPGVENSFDHLGDAVSYDYIRPDKPEEPDEAVPADSQLAVTGPIDNEEGRRLTPAEIAEQLASSDDGEADEEPEDEGATGDVDEPEEEEEDSSDDSANDLSDSPFAALATFKPEASDNEEEDEDEEGYDEDDNAAADAMDTIIKNRQAKREEQFAALALTTKGKTTDSPNVTYVGVNAPEGGAPSEGRPKQDKPAPSQVPLGGNNNSQQQKSYNNGKKNKHEKPTYRKDKKRDNKGDTRNNYRNERKNDRAERLAKIGGLDSDAIDNLLNDCMPTGNADD